MRLTLATAALAALLATAAYADHTPALTSAVVDETGVTGRGARAAVEELLRERDVQLYAVFVRSTGGTSGPDYAEEIARENGLGGNDAVLVVSPTERRYGLWVSSDLRGVTATEVNRMLASRVEPELRAGDWDGAVSAAAGGLGDAVAGDASGARRAGGGALRTLLLLALVAGGVFLVVRALRRRRAERVAAAERARRREQLAGEAAAALIRVDERLRDAETDVRLAAPATDEEGAKQLHADLATARQHMTRAFELRAQEETAPSAELLERALAECEEAEVLLDRVGTRTAELRDLQASAPERLVVLRERLDDLLVQAAAADRTLHRLRSRVPETAKTLDGNLVEARKRIDYARTEALAGEEAAPDMAAAAKHARTAEQSAERAEQLVAAVTHLEQSVAEAEAALPDALREAERAVRAARDVAPSGEGRVARAEAALRQATESRDVVVAVRLAGEAAELAEPVAARATEHARALDAALASAHAAYTTAADYVAARREGIGERPRTRLVMAERELERAERLRGDDADAAYEAARQAERLAYEAYELAAEDFDRLDRYDAPYGGGFGGFGLPLPLPIPILVGGGGGWGGHWGGGWGGGWDGGGGSFGGDFGGGDGFGGTF